MGVCISVCNGESVTCKGLVILFLMFTILTIVIGSLEEPNPVNVTETVVNKDIAHIDKSFNDEQDYFIYTENYCFSVDLTDYNSVNVNDKVTIEEDNSTLGREMLWLNNNTYYQV